MRAAMLVAAFGIPAYAVCLVLAAPATFIADRASRALDGKLHASDSEGTLWSGSLRARLDAPGGAVNIDRLAWRLMPRPLLEGRIAFDVSVESRDVNGRAEIGRSWSQWQARNAAARAEARILPSFFPLISAWRPEGPVSVDARDLRWTERETRGAVVLEWREASVALADLRPLGSYRLAIEGGGESARLVLSTLRGPLRVAGQGEARSAGSIRFSGEARAEPDAAAALEPLLNLMGPKRPDGARAIEVNIR